MGKILAAAREVLARIVAHRQPLMDPTRALARISDVTTQGLPLAQRLWRRARMHVDEAAYRMLGPDFDERAEWLKARYEAPLKEIFG